MEGCIESSKQVELLKVIMKIEKIVLLLIILDFAIAGTTGKLVGRITDARSNEPLVGCTIMVEDTDVGTATDGEGEYLLMNLAPGSYRIRAMMIGYQTKTVTDVIINIDKTTHQNFKLNIQALEGAEVTVNAAAKVIQFDVTNSEARISSKQLDIMPVTDVSDVIKLQGGVTQDAGGGIHIRGGRTSEVMYMVDGVSMTDVFNGGLSVNIENNNIQELQVISGTFNAEYGKAMSGIINMVTKDGKNQFDGGLSYYSGDHTSSDPIYRDLNSYDPLNDLNLEGNLSGPLWNNKITFYSSGRYFRSDGWLNGLNTFNMYGDTLFADKNNNRFRDFAENYFDEENHKWIINGQFLDRGNGRWDAGDPYEDENGNGVWDQGEPFTDIVGNRSWDVGEKFVWDENITTPHYDQGEIFADRGNTVHDVGEPFEDQNGNGLYDRGEPFTDNGNGQWDPAESLRSPYIKGMNWLEKWSTQNKITFKLTPKTKLKFNFLYSFQRKQDYDHSRQMTQAGRKTDYDIGDFKGLSLSHSFSSSSFIEVNLSTFKKVFKSYLYKDPLDPRYITPDSLYWAHTNEEVPNYIIGQYGKNYARYSPDYSFNRWGVDGNHFRRETRTTQFKIDFTSQFNKYNQVKFGLDYQQHKLLNIDATPIDLANDQIYDPLVPELLDLSDLVVQSGLDPLQGNVPSWVKKVQFAGPFTLFGHYYLNQPREFSAYLQDKIEYGDMIVNLGLRYDYFDPNSYMPVNIHDPFFFNPMDPRLDSLLFDGRFNDLLNIDWGDTSHYVTSIDGQDTTWYMYGDFGDYPDKEALKQKKGWWRKTKTTSQISPRLGIAYPISEKGVIHFSYGYFFQIPQFELLYTNPGYVINETASVSGIFGNPELKPQRTQSYELGLQQEITNSLKLELTGYYRDVRDWVSTGVPVDLGISGQTYYSYVNKDYSNVRGVIVAVDKRFSDHYSWHLDYTFQVAEGSNSDPGQEYAALTSEDGALEPTRFILPLDWDQRHTLNGDIYFSLGSFGADLLMQYGSGYPYTPTIGSYSNSGQNIVNDLPNNSRRKQPTLNFDLKVIQQIKIGGFKNGKVYLNIRNLFDQRNELTIWSDTGRSNRTITEATALAAAPQPMRPNTVEEYFNHPEWYSPPREIQIGLDLSW